MKPQVYSTDPDYVCIVLGRLFRYGPLPSLFSPFVGPKHSTVGVRLSDVNGVET